MSRIKILNLKIIVLFITSVLLTACNYSFPVDGVVLDFESGEPIEGVIVLTHWEEATGGHVGSMVCYLVETTVTDKNGRYHIPGWIKKFRNLANKDMYVTPYKKGYERHIIYNTEVDNSKLYLKKFKGTKSERFEYLGRVLSGNTCNNAEESKKKLAVRAKALFDEADELGPETSSQKQLIRAMYYSYEHNLYGSKIADERSKQIYEILDQKGYY